MKKFIKPLIPEKLIILRSLIEGYTYDLKRFSKYSNSYKSPKTQEQYHALITYTYHVVEKGLTMPETKLGFGQTKIYELVRICDEYLATGFNKQAIPLIHSCKVLNEYIEFHHKHHYKLPIELTERIHRFTSMVQEHSASEQIATSKDDFFNSISAPFDQFCLSRHTIRNYSTVDIPLKIFEECTQLAQKTPSACNRQPNHVYVVKDKETKEEILALQSGNRGFGHLANALLIFTGDISAFRFQDERNEVYFNSGMFAMTFIYALHSKQIGACALNWSVTPTKDQKLRKIINIPYNETITLIVSCGYLPDKLKIASSPRKEISEVLHFIA